MFGDSFFKSMKESPLVNSPFFENDTGELFNPLTLPGLTLWLDASDASTVELNGFGQAATWHDKSGNGNNATGTGPSLAKPGYVEPGINGLNACLTGLGYFRVSSLSNLISVDNAYMFVAFKATELETNGDEIYENSGILGQAGTGSNIGIFINQGLTAFAYNNDGTPDDLDLQTDIGISSIFSYTHNGGEISASADLGAILSEPSGDTSSIANSLYIGCTKTSAFNNPENPFKGLIGEVIVGNGILNQTQVELTREYLYNKWKEPPLDTTNAYTDSLLNPYFSEDYTIYTSE